MKKVLLIVGMLSLSVMSFGQSKFETAMLSNIDSFYRSLASGAVQKPINSFKELSQTNKNRWEPSYYAAYGYCILSLHEKDDSKKDAYCDSAQGFLNKALALQPKESELYVIQGFLYNMRLIVNPMMRAFTYLNQIEESYNTAEKLDSLNPRVYYMRAQLIFNTPSFFGGGKDKALPIFQKAKQKFETFTTTNKLAPTWGKETCLKKIEECAN
jgi:tetratricopeptide (TPR) repeat protein